MPPRSREFGLRTNLSFLKPCSVKPGCRDDLSPSRSNEEGSHLRFYVGHDKMKSAIVFIWFALIMNSSGDNDKGSQAFTLPEEPTAAWAEGEKVHMAIQAPMEWRTSKPTVEEVARFRQQVCNNAVSFANKAREFIQRFPNENIGDARIIVVHAFNHAVAAGDATAEREIQGYVATTLADKNIPENDRVGVFLYSGNTAFCKKVGMRLFTVGMRNLDSQYEENELDALKRALKQFPTNALIYALAVGMAQRSPAPRQKELAEMILSGQGAPPAVKTLANHLLKGTQPFEIGKPLSIQFTALDGREVDLAKLKGKVVLVEFWSTSCRPCVAEMPRVKAAYEKSHERGAGL